ncbi:hypothetical protein [Nocardiopsis sp. NRRL B-16309]|uniref:hypothetical protein n=1 Tax=Nocardiopsis sp. NRRL B-16309 TaxID=1519494 RepID=UPI000A8A2C62|nr:hypothetical protein [Nocardiopsis sp. NRRL B-16309]
MSDTRSEPFGGKRFGCALALMLCFLTFLWLLSGLLAIGHDEHCRHGFVGPGERTAWEEEEWDEDDDEAEGA